MNFAKISLGVSALGLASVIGGTTIERTAQPGSTLSHAGTLLDRAGLLATGIGVAVAARHAGFLTYTGAVGGALAVGVGVQELTARAVAPHPGTSSQVNWTDLVVSAH